jgi:hypothetical protein
MTESQKCDLAKMNTVNELVSVLRIDIRQGNTENLRHWINQLPLQLVWSVLLNTYANDIGCAPLATHIWKKYKEGDILAAYDVANSLCVQKKSRTVRFVTTVFWKNSFSETEPFKKLLGQLVGDLQSAYRYNWDPHLQFRIFAAASKLDAVGIEDAWEYIMEISAVLGKPILRNLAALRSMYKLTDHIEFFIFGIVAITQPGEWEISEPANPKPFVSPTWIEPVPDYCHDLTTQDGWDGIAIVSLDRGYTPIRAIKWGVQMYYKASLKVSNERTNIVTPIYKQYSIITDTHCELNPPKGLENSLNMRLQTIKMLQKMPRKKGILNEILNNSKNF